MPCERHIEGGKAKTRAINVQLSSPPKPSVAVLQPVGIDVGDSPWGDGTGRLWRNKNAYLAWRSTLTANELEAHDAQVSRAADEAYARACASRLSTPSQS